MKKMNYIKVGPPEHIDELNVVYACALHGVYNNQSGGKVTVTDACDSISPHDIIEPLPCNFLLHDSSYANALSVGDFAQVVLRSNLQNPVDVSYWTQITRVDGEWLEAVLEPMVLTPDLFGIENIAAGTSIRMKRSHVFRVRFSDPQKYGDLQPATEFHDRGCFVDEQVLSGKLPITYLYREVSNSTLKKGDLPDSGWRLRTEISSFSEEEMRSAAASYVPLGAVLRVDDSWIDLVDEPLGAAFRKNSEMGSFERVREGTRLGKFLFVHSVLP